MMSEQDVASKMDLPAPATLAEAIRQRDAWINTGAQFSRNADYYRGLVEQIGKMLGPDAFTADDGSVHDAVLCAKVPELVAARLAH